MMTPSSSSLRPGLVAALCASLLPMGATARVHAPPGPGDRDLLQEAFQGITFGATVAEVTDLLDGQYGKLTRVDPESPVFPLARDAESHLIALEIHSVGVAEVAFTFADDALVLVEARGGAVEGLLPGLEGDPESWLDYTIWLNQRVVACMERDVVWLLGPEALHPHLYLWENPNLPSGAAASKSAPSARKPECLAFGATMETLLPRIQAQCPRTEREEIAPPWLPSEPASQFQINAYGVGYAGFPRKVEAVFGDDRLQLVWILTGKGEEGRLRKALSEAYGAAVFVSKSWEVFDEWRVALRKDKPEVLMIADELIPAYSESIRTADD